MMPSNDTTVEMGGVIRSPEQVTLQLPVTGPTSRILAYGIVGAIILAIQITVVLLLIGTAPLRVAMLEWLRGFAEETQRGGNPFGQDFMMMAAVWMAITLVCELLYFVVWETLSGGRSPGKTLLGLRVVRDGGLPITPRASLIRNLLRIVDELPISYLVGLTTIVCSADGKRLGDLAAGTVVVRVDRPPPARTVQTIDEQRLRAFRFDHTQASRLGAPEATLARETLRRLATLPADEHQALIDRSVAALCERIGYGTPPADGEGFLHAVLAVRRWQ
jgi:uncharacterized RDD family membrane protein YckC